MSMEDDLKSVVESYIRIAEESEYESFEILLRLRFREAQSLEICSRSPGVNNYTSDILQLPDTLALARTLLFRVCQVITKALTEFALKNPTFIFTFFDCDEEKVRFEASSAANIDDRVVQLYSQRYRDVNKVTMSLHGCDIQIFIFVADGSNSIKRSLVINDDYTDDSLRSAVEKDLNIYPGTRTEDLKFVAIFKDIFDRKITLKALSWKLKQEVTARFDPVKFKRHCHENSFKFYNDELQDHGDDDDFKLTEPLKLKPSPVIDLTEFSQQNDENLHFSEVIRDDDYLDDEVFYKVCGSDGMSVDEVEGEEHDRLIFYTPPIDEKLLQKFLNDDQRCLKKETHENKYDIENSQNEPRQSEKPRKIEFDSEESPIKPRRIALNPFRTAEKKKPSEPVEYKSDMSNIVKRIAGSPEPIPKSIPKSSLFSENEVQHFFDATKQNNKRRTYHAENQPRNNSEAPQRLSLGNVGPPAKRSRSQQAQDKMARRYQTQSNSRAHTIMHEDDDDDVVFVNDNNSDSNNNGKKYDPREIAEKPQRKTIFKHRMERNLNKPNFNSFDGRNSFK